MYNILNGLNVSGDIQFSGNLIGNIPSASVSTDSYNSIKSTDTGLYSAFGFENLPPENIINKGTMTVTEVQEFSSTILVGEKPTSPTLYTWSTTIGNGTLKNSAATIIPTEGGKYIILAGYPLDSTGNVTGLQGMYFPDGGSPSLFLSFIEDNNYPVDSRNGNQKTDYDQLFSTNTYIVSGVSASEMATYHAPFASDSEVRVYVQNTTINGVQNTSQMVISTQGIFYRSGVYGNLPSTWQLISSNASVTIDPANDNILQNRANGLFVSAANPAIPKFTSTTLYMNLDSPLIYPNGSRKYTATVSLNNPTGVANYNNVGLYRIADVKLNHYFLDADGNPIQTQVFFIPTTTTSSQLNYNVKVFIYGNPAGVYSAQDDSPWPSSGEVSNFSVSILILVGSTLSNLGYT